MIINSTEINETYNGYITNDFNAFSIREREAYDVENITPFGLHYNYKDFIFMNHDTERSIYLLFKANFVGWDRICTIRIPLFTFSRQPVIIERPKRKKDLIIDDESVMLIDDLFMNKSVNIFQFYTDSLLYVNKYIFGKLWTDYFEDIEWDCIINR